MSVKKRDNFADLTRQESRPQREYLEYVSWLLAKTTDTKFEEVRALLEAGHSAEELSDYKLAACDQVRRRDNMNERMEAFRSKSTEQPVTMLPAAEPGEARGLVDGFVGYRAAMRPNPKNVRELREALSCFEGVMCLETPVEVLIAVDPSKPYLLKIRNLPN